MKRRINKNNTVYHSTVVQALAMGVVGAFALTTQASALEKVGVQAAVHGTVNLIAPEKDSKRSGKSGDGVYFLETVESGVDSGLQILLLDETTFTVGPQSEIIIDEMVYDPSGNSKLIVNVAKGAFRYISGEIAKQNPENVTIRTPNGEIGIRGTSFFAVSKPETGGWYFGLLGPGPNNNTGDKAGGIVFKNEFGNAEVRRSGFGFSVEPGAAPSAVGTIPAEIITQFEKQVSGVTPQTGEGVASAIADAKNDGLEGSFSDIAAASGNITAITSSVVVAETISQDLQSALSGTAASAASAASSVDGLTPLNHAQLRGYTGVVSYAQNNVPMYFGQFPNTSGELTSADLKDGLSRLNGTVIGKYDFAMSANFNTRNLSGDYSNINVPTLGVSTGINAVSFNINYGVLPDVTKVEVNSYQASIGGGYDGDAMVTFVDGGGSLPNALQALSLRETATSKEVAIGASIIKP
ncbi:MAG: FecR family protein [Rhodospirillaceae bacterium]|nr:FecR family protein [Rhodospirillaceae bacterium]